MKVNLRWVVQAAAFIGCIYFFMNAWNASKSWLLAGTNQALTVALNGGLFLVCFLVMAVTSYIKQKQNGTLKNPIAFFEKLLSKIGLA